MGTLSGGRRHNHKASISHELLHLTGDGLLRSSKGTALKHGTKIEGGQSRRQVPLEDSSQKYF